MNHAFTITYAPDLVNLGFILLNEPGHAGTEAVSSTMSNEKSSLVQSPSTACKTPGPLRVMRGQYHVRRDVPEKRAHAQSRPTI
jgi:hypothetical protein